MIFDDLKELRKEFTTGKVKKLPEQITVDSVNYKLLNSTNYPFEEVVNEGKKPMIIYALDHKTDNMERYESKHTDADDPSSMQDRLVMVWANQRSFVKPVESKFVPKARMTQVMVREGDTIVEAGDPKDDHDIGTKLEIVLSTFNSNKPIDAKVDTGAEMSSIRVNNLQVNERQGVCSFNFYNKNITMGYDGFQAVKVGDKTENRPLVSFNVTVPTSDVNNKDITLSNVKFNLNNIPDQEIVKGDDYMDILLGMNFVNAGKFRVVGRAKATVESVDWDALQEMFKDLEVPLEESVEESMEVKLSKDASFKVYEAIKILKDAL